MTKNNNSGSFVGHLTELRSRLVKSFVFLIFLFVVSYIFSTDIYRFLVQPYADAVLAENLDRRLIFTALHEAFLTYLKVAFLQLFLFPVLFFLSNYGNLLRQDF
jgi:sec-independent protein translocase protein TatC